MASKRDIEAVVVLEVLRFYVLGLLTSTLLLLSVTKKRKRTEHREETIESITGLFTKATESIEKIATRIGYDKDCSERRRHLYATIGALPLALTLKDHVRVTIMLAKNTSAMEMFYGLPVDAKSVMIRMVLDGKLKLT